MNSNEWDVIWRRQELQVGKGADVKILFESFEVKRKKQARALWIRDISEASASIIVAAAFGAIAVKSPEVGWLMWPAVVIVLCVGSVFVLERIRASRVQLEASKPLIEKLDADIAELRHQKQLIGKVGTWYLAPLAGAILLVMGAMILKAYQINKRVLHEPIVYGFLVGYLIFCLGLFVGVWKLNRHAVQKRIGPRLEELEKLRSYILHGID